MKRNTENALKWIGLSEGGYVDHPKDPGGKTDRGITQRTFDAWNRAKGQPPRPVRGISKAEAEAIIVQQYFAPVRFDDLPDGLDYAVADYAVNSGPAQAVRDLQRLVGVQADGVMGMQTLAAVRSRQAVPLIEAYCDRRLAFLRGLRTWPTFGRGWASRVATVRNNAVALSLGHAEMAEAPEPAPERAPEAETSAGTDLRAILKDPAALIPAAGAALAPILSGMGPVQWALAALIVMAGIYALVRAVRRARA